MNENLIAGTEACKMLGLSTKQPHAKQLRQFGLSPVFAKRVGRGFTTFYERDPVLQAAAKVAAARAERPLFDANGSGATRRPPTRWRRWRGSSPSSTNC